mgnify:CR=1 FL=1
MFTLLKAQTKIPIPEYTVTLGAGAGPTYGVIGFKSVLGKKGNGFLLSLGKFNEKLKYQLGFQFCTEYLFINASYGSVGEFQYEQDGSTITESLSGITLIIGGMVNLGKEKRFFIDPGVGVSTPFMYKESALLIGELGFRIAVGVGYRIGGYKKG